MQEQFITSQEETDKELAFLEAKIDLLSKTPEEKEQAPGKGGRA